MAKTANEPPKYPEIGARLTQFIKDSGELNPRQFALKAGLAPQLIHNLASGYSMPGGETLLALTKAFRKFDATWLLTGAESQLPPQVPSELKPLTPPASPGKQTDEELRRQMTIVAESSELREVKSERDHLREVNQSLLAIIRNFSGGATDAPAAAGGGKANASSDAASLLETVDAIAAEYQSQDRIFVAGLWRSGGRHLRIA